jgi:succinate dehydrogenase / fumarate reductase cytochrome b subunit
MAEYFKSAGVKAIYIIGILSAVFHLSWGLWSFLIKWGFLTTPVGQKRVFFGCMALFVLMSAVGIHILFSFQ